MSAQLRLALITAALCTLLPTRAIAQDVVEYYGVDAIGSVRVVFDAAGTVTSRMDYGPFGEQLAPSTMGAKSYAQLFRDGEIGQDYAQARSYQFRTGRFGAPDSIFAGVANPQRLNRYAYVHNDPLSFIDPSGLSDCRFNGRVDCDVIVRPPGPGPGRGTPGPGGGSGGGDSGEDPGCTPFPNFAASDSDCGGGEPPPGGGAPPQTPPPPTTPPNPNPPPPVPPPPVPPPPVPAPAPPVRSTWDCFKANFKFAWNGTHEFFYIHHPEKTVAGMALTGQVAKAAGTVTVGGAILDTWKTFSSFAPAARIYGVANLGVGGTAVSVGANALIKTGLVVAPGLEGGMAIGSAINAGYSTGFGWCGSGAR